MNDYKMIDIKEAQNVLIGFINLMKNGLVFIVHSVKHSLLLFLLMVVLCFAAGYYYWHSKPTYYQAEMVCNFNNLHKKIFGEMVHQLDNLAQTGSYIQLSNTLHITPQQATTILGFDAKNMAGSPLYEDITTEKLPMYFTVRTTDKKMFPVLQNAILDYLNSSPYQNLKNKLEGEKIEEKIKYLNHAMIHTDSVIDAYTHFLFSTKSVTDSTAGFSNIAALFNYQKQLADQKLEQEEAKQLLQSVNLIYGFQPTDTPILPSKKWLISWFLVSLLISTGVVLVKKIWVNG